MKIFIAIDEITTLNPKNDSSLFFANALLDINADVYFFHPATLHYESDVKADVFKLDSSLNKSPTSQHTFAKDDIVLLRHNPPVNMTYITTCQFFKYSACKVINNISTMVTFPEKLIPLYFRDYIPRSIITSCPHQLRDFIKKMGAAVIKSIHGFGGNEVLKVTINTLDEAHQFLQAHHHIIAQEFLPEIKHGDKRILVIDGTVVGALRRIPPAEKFLANMGQGGVPEVCTLTAQEQKIANLTANWCRQNGIVFAGIDLIDEFLIEVNITCPTGFKTLHDLAPSLGLNRLVCEAIVGNNCNAL